MDGEHPAAVRLTPHVVAGHRRTRSRIKRGAQAVYRNSDHRFDRLGWRVAVQSLELPDGANSHEIQALLIGLAKAGPDLRETARVRVLLDGPGVLFDHRFGDGG